MGSLQHITVNRIGKPHYVVKNGRGYYVAPMTLIVPGVLNGSQGALYYPPEEIARDHGAWNGIPLVSYHPTSLSGGHLSASDDGVLDKQGIGDFFGSHINDKGMLRGQGWFDVEKCNKVNRNILNSVKAGKQIELSTGLYTDNHPAPQGSHFQGKPYTHIARNYRPDHVAILADQVGACSLRDGCGVYNQERLAYNSEWTQGEANHGYRKWTHSDGRTVELRNSTVYGKSGRLRDPKQTKQVAVVDLNGQEHKAFSVRGEGHEHQKALADKVIKHLQKTFGIDATPHFSHLYDPPPPTENCGATCTCGGTCGSPKRDDPDCPT